MFDVRRLSCGVAVGFLLGYTAVRGRDAVRDLRRPASPLQERDPKRYGAVRRRLMLAGIARSVSALATTAFVTGEPLDRLVHPLPPRLRAPAFVAIVALTETLRDVPVDYVEEHVLERVYGNSEQTARAWAADQLKAAGVGIVVAMLLTALADAIVRRAPRRWPWIAIGAMPPLLALANVVAPTFIMPLFNRFAPLHGPLEGTIRELAARYGVGNASILRFDMSRQTKKANAFVTGIFGTERIALADTLIERFPDDETLFVVAHELGHYVRRDPWISIALGTVFAAAMILIGDRAVQRTTGRRVERAADGARFVFYAALAGTIGSPLMAAASRAVERRADRFALAATGDPRSGVRAFRRLRDQNLAEDEAPKWAEILFASHPSLKSRIERLEAAAGDRSSA